MTKTEKETLLSNLDKLAAELRTLSILFKKFESDLYAAQTLIYNLKENEE